MCLDWHSEGCGGHGNHDCDAVQELLKIPMVQKQSHVLFYFFYRNLPTVTRQRSSELISIVLKSMYASATNTSYILYHDEKITKAPSPIKGARAGQFFIFILFFVITIRHFKLSFYIKNNGNKELTFWRRRLRRPRWTSHPPISYLPRHCLPSPDHRPNRCRPTLH